MEVQFFIPGAPVAKGRPRVMKSGVTFTPQKTRDAEKMVAVIAERAMKGKPPLAGPLAMTYHVTLGVPESWPNRKRQDAFLGTLMPIGRPDLDNIAKLVADACNGIVYADDSQIVEMNLRKSYGNGEIGAKVLISSVGTLGELFEQGE